MKFPTLARMCDSSAAGLVLVAFWAAFFFMGMAYAQMKVHQHCDESNEVFFDGDRYACFSEPRGKP